MQTSIVIRKLTDGSEVYSVVFVDGDKKAVIDANDERGANELHWTFARHAAHATIEPMERI